MRCDLYILTSGFSYVDVYGFNTQAAFGPTLTTTTTIKVEIPKLRVRNTILSYDAFIKFKFMEETPGMINPEVTLYQSNEIKVHSVIDDEKTPIDIATAILTLETSDKVNKDTIQAYDLSSIYSSITATDHLIVIEVEPSFN